MAFNQKKMDRVMIQTRDIFNVYVYESETDALADITTTPGYFDDSRFVIDSGWPGSWIWANLSDGSVALVIGEDGRTVKKL